MMSCAHANAFLPNMKLGLPSRRGEKCEAFQRFVCSPSKYRNFDPICLAKLSSSSQSERFPRLVASPLKNRRVNAICSAKGGSKSENEYIYLIRGAELTRLAGDHIKYLFGHSASVRLR